MIIYNIKIVTPKTSIPTQLQCVCTHTVHCLSKFQINNSHINSDTMLYTIFPDLPLLTVMFIKLLLC